MKTIAFDIETIADPAMIEFLPEVSPDSRLKDAGKIEADIAAKKKKQIAEMGLDPMTSIICCIGWATTDADGKPMAGSILLKNNDEKELLFTWWDYCANGFDQFVSFNGRAFDLRHILLHGMAHGVRPSVNIDKGRYNKGNHVDMRLVLAGEDKFAHGKLGYFSQKFLGRSSKDGGLEGSKVQEYWDMALYDDIAKYCQEDCRDTYDLWVMAEAAGLLE